MLTHTHLPSFIVRKIPKKEKRKTLLEMYEEAIARR
jgi:hypothetical protein